LHAMYEVARRLPAGLPDRKRCTEALVLAVRRRLLPFNQTSEFSQRNVSFSFLSRFSLPVKARILSKDMGIKTC
jgi:hypothetical protein